MRANFLEHLKNGELTKNILLYKGFEDDPSEPADERLTLSEGTCPAAPLSRPGNVYMDFAYLPKAPWRIPTAREIQTLVTKEIPSTSAPRACAAIASGTVDIPTKSPPIVRIMRISAGVS